MPLLLPYDQPIGRVWVAVVETPFFKLPRMARLVLGWVSNWVLTSFFLTCPGQH